MSRRDVNRIADKFAALLLAMIGAKNYAKVQWLNAHESNENVCHSHDFCDANMVMQEAFESYGYGPRMAGDWVDNDQDLTALWNAAWKRAEAKHLGGRKS